MLLKKSFLTKVILGKFGLPCWIYFVFLEVFVFITFFPSAKSFKIVDALWALLGAHHLDSLWYKICFLS